MLLYMILHDLAKNSSSKGLFPAKQDTGIEVASFGGGPGTDAAGLVWIQKELFPGDSVYCSLYDYEKSWKRYLKTLSDFFLPAVELSFFPCDVTASLHAEMNRKVDVSTVDLLLLFYVCHETSQRRESLSFYEDLAMQAKEGAVVVIADVQSHSASHLADVMRCMASKRTLCPLQLKRQHPAEVLAFRLGSPLFASAAAC